MTYLRSEADRPPVPAGLLDLAQNGCHADDLDT